MKFKMTKERIDTINELLKTHGDALTAFYDEAFYLGSIRGAIAGALVSAIAANGILIRQIIINSKEEKTES